VKIGLTFTANELTNLFDAVQAYVESGAVNDWTDSDREALDRAYQILMDAEVRAGRKLGKRIKKDFLKGND
jgi:hypothetical protein